MTDPVLVPWRPFPLVCSDCGMQPLPGSHECPACGEDGDGLIDTEEMLRQTAATADELDDWRTSVKAEREAARAGTVRVRVAVAVQPDGDWNAVSWRDGTDDNNRGMAIDPMSDEAVVHFVEADVPLPTGAVTVEGRVDE